MNTARRLVRDFAPVIRVVLRMLRHFARAKCVAARLVRDFPLAARAAPGLVNVLVATTMLIAPRQFEPGVIIEGPGEATLTTVAPRFTVRALGVPTDKRPLRFTVYITRNSTGDSPYVDQIDVTSTDTIVSIPVTHLLQANTTVYWKARVTLPDGAAYESAIVGPKLVPPWLKLIEPNSPNGEQVYTRRPRFVWKSPKVDASIGPWNYEIQILNNNGTEIAASGLTDTIYVPPNELEANRPYRWQVRASVKTGESVTEKNLEPFFVNDPSLPTTTLFYKNFPNPFPTPNAFSTCFWFDVGSGGANIRLDITDLRGNLVQTIVNNERLDAGTYGRGIAGAASNCDNRFVWDGRSSVGITVPPGVYLARFSANGKSPTFVKVLFRGR